MLGNIDKEVELVLAMELKSVQLDTLGYLFLTPALQFA